MITLAAYQEARSGKHTGVGADDDQADSGYRVDDEGEGGERVLWAEGEWLMD